MGIVVVCACGSCEACRRRAGVAVAAYARKQRRGGRWGRDAYMHAQVKLLLAMTGVTEDLDGEELRRSEWGAAMRDRRKTSEGD